MNKEQLKNRKNDYIFNQYDRGGSRIYINGEAGDRQLLVDTFYDKDFAEYINKCTKEYFFETLKEPEEKTCGGCNVREPFEHKCHGENCNCKNPVCMEKQGKITHDELMVIVNEELYIKQDKPKGKNFLKWFEELSLEERFYKIIKHNELIKGDNTRHPDTLTVKEVEIIFNAEFKQDKCIKGFEAKSHYCFECEKENNCNVSC